MKPHRLPHRLPAQAGRGANGLQIIVSLALALFASWFLFFGGRFQIQRWVVEQRYKAAGYRMQPGCNAGWANRAMFDLWSVSNRIEEAQWAPVPDTNELSRLQQEYVASQKELAFRDEDCRKRGHAHTVPVKILTNTPPK
jgi:hypothetical protein